MVKKGVFFSLDALIAVIIILAVLIVVPVFYLKKEQTTQPVYFSSDLIQLISTMKIGDINNPAVKTLLNNNNVTDLNKTVVEQILRFTVEGNKEKAEELLNITTGGLLPPYYHFGIWIEGYEQPIFASSNKSISQLISSKQLVSGIEKGRAIEGLAARAFLSKINERTDSSYAYFGGYEGDGNITKKIILPGTVNSIDSAYMELDAGSSFDLYINNIPSGNYNSSKDMGADQWAINSSFINNFHEGENTVMLSFTGNNKYIGGGYIRVGYTTSELMTYNETGTKKYYFPGIDGVINLYSSFFIPGSLNNMNIRLHYESDYELFLNIGETTVFSYELPAENTVNITDAELSLQLDYASISDKTVPLRLGLRNVSLAYGGKSDAVLITDRTGSMGACDVNINCSTPGICDTSPICHERRDRVAQNSDRTFINEMLNIQGNTVGLVGYGKRTAPVCSFHDLSTYNQSLQNRIDDYYNEWCGWTCISCGIVAASQLLTENKQLYSSTIKSDYDNTQYHLGDSGSLSVTETLSIPINRSKFIKGRLTIFGRGVDTESGYKNCIFLNDHYLGRMCVSSDTGDVGWHTCSYPIKEEWLPPSGDAGSWTTTTQNDFQSCTTSNVDLTTYPGDVILNITEIEEEIPEEYFTDDFNDGNSDGWLELGGNWDVRDINGNSWQPGENGIYRQTQNSVDTRTVAGDSQWQDYKFNVSLRSNDNDPLGVYFRYQDSSHYYRFEFTDGDPYYGFRLYRNTGSGDTLIASSYWNPGRGVWYKIHTVLEGSSVKVYFDKGSGLELIFNLPNGGGPTNGMVGLYSNWAYNADFDNIFVNQTQLFTYSTQDNFDDGNSDGWSESGGNWDVRDINGNSWQPGENGIYRQTQNYPNTYTTMGNTNWKNYAIETSIRSNDNDPLGIYFRYQDSSHYYRFEFTDGDPYYGFRLYRNTGSGDILIASDYSWNPGRYIWYQMKAEVNGDNVKAYFDKGSGYELIFDLATGGGPEKGKIGLYSYYAYQADFDNVIITLQDSSNGIVLSPVYDAGSLASWDSLTWTQTLTTETNISIDIRTGNTPTPDISWNNYAFNAEPYSSISEENISTTITKYITQSSGRYLQWRALLSTSNVNLTPILSDVTINYSIDTETNYVTITGANTVGCLDDSGEQDDWDFKEVNLKVWESQSEIQQQSFFDSALVALDDGSETKTTAFNTGIPPSEMKSAYLTFEAIDVDPNYYDCIYLNNHYIGRVDYQHWSGDNVWQNVTFDIPTMALTSSTINIKITSGTTYGCLLTSGDNDYWRYRNLNFTIKSNNQTTSYDRFMSMLVMSDGEANTKIGTRYNYDTSGARAEAIQKACEAYNNHDIHIYSVAFGNGADASLMQDIACCDDCNNYYNANNAEELLDIYKEIAREIIKLQYEAQVANVTGNISTTLFPDSYIEFNYTPQLPPYEYGRIPITAETPRFNNNITEGTFYLPNNALVYDAKITSYSSDKWTDKALIKDNGNWIDFYNLSAYGSIYYLLGDPYIVNIPIELVKQGENSVRIGTGISPFNSTGGSPDDRAIYTIGIDLDINYTGVFAKAQGCDWTVKFEDGTESIIPIPRSYSGDEDCYFDETTDCDELPYSDDAINNAVCNLFKQLDFNNTGRLFIKFGPTDLDVETYSIGKKIPYMWGPTVVEVRVWK